MKHLIAPSMLASDLGRINEEIVMINNSEADWIHVDVMDGHFVPNITFGPNIVEAMAKFAQKPLDVHLMIEKPERYVQSYINAGASILTVHLEACTHLHSVISMIRDKGIKAGVSINPHTHVESLEDILEELDMVLIMSVNPGFGGQKFIHRTLAKLRRLREMVTERNLQILIEVDGGIGLQNAQPLLMAGANVLVAGSSIFGTPDPLDTIRKFKAIGSDSW
ncbi:MAG TPA: ribulose-phosphate 3-epimerase [Saprospirales bacterium]|nr:ribulose-phosphate 3-epimerase [Saprospirales bacterium]HAY71178.1 ribulose-phosphate 3-epimerase [Saprospirales bacterium]